MIPLAALAARHCAAHKPAFTLDAFLVESCSISGRHFRDIAAGKCRATDQFLQRLHRTHVRLFPAEPVDVALPDGRVAHLGPDRLTITFPSTPNN
jgi:hypothetical protein